MPNAPKPVKPFALNIDGREKAALTGVTDVESFDDTAVVLHTHGGRLTITGKGLHVSALQLEDGRLMLEGAIDSAAYDNAKSRRSFWRKALG